MVQSVEILLDPDLDAQVRAEWAALADAGLPGQADHAGASNAPHVTLLAADALDPAADAALDAVGLPGPVPVRLGGLLVLPGRRRVVLARAVVPDVALLDLQSRVRSAVAGGTGVPPYFEAGSWTPHVTLSRHLGRDTVGRALEALADAPRELVGHVAQVRRWDSEARRTWPLPR